MSQAKIGVYLGSKWWNNGVVNKRSHECPGDGWVKGQVRNHG